MAYPPYIQRHTNFRQQESAGQQFSTAALDADLNDSYETANQINLVLRGITTATGRLQNVAAQIAAALVGSERFAIAAPQTVFLTAIAWQPTFSSLNVQVIANGEAVDSNDVTVADDGGFLEVTLADAVALGWVRVSAYEQGAGVLTRLADISDPANGANMVGVQDVDGHFVSVTVEGALAELAQALDDLTTSLGTIANLWTANGVSLGGTGALADWDLGGYNIKDLADAVDPQDAVTLAQVQALVQNLDTLLTIFIRSDGSVDFTADQSMGDNKLTDVADPTADQDAVNRRTMIAADTVVRQSSLSVSGLKDPEPARGALGGGLNLGRSASVTADVDQSTAPLSVTEWTVFGVPRPGAPDHVSNRQYVDEQVAQALGGGADKSPYALQRLGRSVTLPDFDGAITNIAAGGVFAGSDLTVTVPQAPAVSTYVFVDGDIDIQDTLTLAVTHTLELLCTGNITISAALSAGDIRLRAAGTITTTAGGTLTATAPGGVVAVDADGGFALGGDISGSLVFCYANVSSVISGDIRALLVTPAGQGPILGDADGRYWGSPSTRAAGRNGAGPVAMTDRRYLPDRDYMCPYAGNPALNAGARGQPGGGGAVAGGAGVPSDLYGSNAPAGPARGSLNLWAYPAAPGGSGAWGDSTAGPDAPNGVFGGGVIVVRVTGDLDLTGSTLDSSGVGVDTGLYQASSGSGGGTVKVAARGAIDDGGFESRGGPGTGGAVQDRGASGGGGTIVVAATSYTGTQTTNVLNGTGVAGAPYDGTAEVVTLTTDEWDALEIQGLWDR